MDAPVAPSIVVVDNYDSFTWNLVQYLEEAGAACTVLLNDRTSVPEILALSPRGVLLSPGPGTPEESGVTLDVVAEVPRVCPVLGVCLGLQAIGRSFGASVRPAREPVHGRARAVVHRGDPLFEGIPSPFLSARYHSLAVDAATLPEVLVATAHSEDGELMALRHRALPVSGVQFHPESILSEHGRTLLRNWLRTL